MGDSVTIGRGVLEVDVDATGAQTKLDATTRSVEAYVKKIQEQAANVGKTAAEIKLQELAQRGATQAPDRMLSLTVSVPALRMAPPPP